MGCDIHIEVFAKVKKRAGDGPDIVRIPPPPEWLWEDNKNKNYLDIQTSFPSWPSIRCYAAFGLLAGVRGDDDPPYPPRGLPDFLKPYGKEVTYQGWAQEDEYIWPQRIGYDQFIDVRLDLGDHTRSWLTLDELKRIDWNDWNYKYDDEKKTTLLWPATILIPMLEKIAAYRDVEEIYVVFGFDS